MYIKQELYLGLHCFWYAFQNVVVDQVLFHGFRCDGHGSGSVIVVDVQISSERLVVQLETFVCRQVFSFQYGLHLFIQGVHDFYALFHWRFGRSWVWWYLFIKVSSFIETMQRATVLLQMQSVLVGIPKIHLSVRSLSSF